MEVFRQFAVPTAYVRECQGGRLKPPFHMNTLLIQKLQPTTLADVQHAVRDSERLHVRGAGTKTGLHAASSVATTLDVSALRGVIDYQPQEFVIAAFAGTPVAEIETLLAQQGQYLPFDPLLSGRGATLGGMVATNANGSGRFRFGGVRDFIIGANFVDGAGTLIHGGGKVVKNAAGFDYPKLMVGSFGRLGVLVELVFKVFPKPDEYTTVRITKPNIAEATAAMLKLMGAPLDLEALDILCGANGVRPVVEIRVGGIASSLPQRIARIQQMAGEGEVLSGEAEREHWQQVREFGWAGDVLIGDVLIGDVLIGDGPITKIPLTPEKMAGLDALLANSNIARRYCVGGNVAYVASAFANAQWPGLLLLGDASLEMPSTRGDHALAQRVKFALDPQGKFV